MSLNIADTLKAASRGDPDAARALLEQFGPRIRAEIDADISAPWRSLIDADDVMQVTYLEAFLQIHTIEGRDEASFVAWLRRIAANNLRDAIKELQRQKRPNPAKRVQPAAGESSYVALVEMLGCTTTTPSRDAAHGELGRIIDGLLAQLPPDYATVIREYDLRGKTIQEVAAAMGRSAGAVHMLRARAHDRLRTLLGAESKYFTHTA